MTGGRTQAAASQGCTSSCERKDEDPSGAGSGPRVESVWIFGYGSLLWKTNFPYEEMQVGYVKGYIRRFWQGSTDHRGVPGSPGRVVTLVPTKDDECTWGVAYKVQPKDVTEVMAYLNHREKCGYTTQEVEFYSNKSPSVTLTTLVYISTEFNPEYLGSAPLDVMARQVVSARGESGCNIQYVLELAAAMRVIAPGVDDQHLFRLEEKVKELMTEVCESERKALAASQLDCKCRDCSVEILDISKHS